MDPHGLTRVRPVFIYLLGLSFLESMGVYLWMMCGMIRLPGCPGAEILPKRQDHRAKTRRVLAKVISWPH